MSLMMNRYWLVVEPKDWMCFFCGKEFPGKKGYVTLKLHVGLMHTRINRIFEAHAKDLTSCCSICGWYRKKLLHKIDFPRYGKI